MKNEKTRGLELFSKIFPAKKPIIAMLHVFEGPLDEQVRQALQDLAVLGLCVDAVLVENYGWGYANDLNATAAAVADIKYITSTVVKNTTLPVGINLLPNDFYASMKIAHEVGARFIQMDHVVGNFVERRSVNPLLVQNARIIYPDIAILGGIHPKYYTLAHPMPKIEDSAKKAMELCDAIVITGEKTGGQANIQDIVRVRRFIGKDFPIIIGSGLNPRNTKEQLYVTDGAIVGSAFRKNGVHKGSPILRSRVVELMSEVKQLRD